MLELNFNQSTNPSISNKERRNEMWIILMLCKGRYGLYLWCDFWLTTTWFTRFTGIQISWVS